MLVIGDERRRDAVMGEQGLGDARILGDHRIGGGERRERAERNIGEIADRASRRHAGRADRLGLGPQAEGGEVPQPRAPGAVGLRVDFLAASSFMTASPPLRTPVKDRRVLYNVQSFYK